jgi:hypothetical protein
MARRRRNNPDFPTIIAPFGVTADALGQMLPAIGAIPVAIGAQLGAAAEARASKLLRSPPLVKLVVDKISKRVDAHVRPIRELRGLVVRREEREVFVEAADRAVRHALNDLAPMLGISIITMYPNQFLVRLPDDAHKAIIGIMTVAAYIHTSKDHLGDAGNILVSVADFVQMVTAAAGSGAARQRLLVRHGPVPLAGPLIDKIRSRHTIVTADEQRASDRPVAGKTYALTGPNSLASGNDWAGSEVRDITPRATIHTRDSSGATDSVKTPMDPLTFVLAHIPRRGHDIGEVLQTGKTLDGETAFAWGRDGLMFAASTKPVTKTSWMRMGAHIDLVGSSVATTEPPSDPAAARLYRERCAVLLQRHIEPVSYRDWGAGLVSIYGTQASPTKPFTVDWFWHNQAGPVQSHAYADFDDFLFGVGTVSHELAHTESKALTHKKQSRSSEHVVMPSDAKGGRPVTFTLRVVETSKASGVETETFTKTVTAPSVPAALAVWREFVDRGASLGLASESIRDTELFDPVTGAALARVSYNGCIWPPGPYRPDAPELDVNLRPMRDSDQAPTAPALSSTAPKRYYHNNDGWSSESESNQPVTQIATGVAGSMSGARVEMMNRGRTAVVLKGGVPVYAASERPLGAAEWAQIEAVAMLRASTLATSPIPKTGDAARVYAARLAAATTGAPAGDETWYRDWGSDVVSFVGTQRSKKAPYIFSLFPGKQTRATVSNAYSTFDEMVAGLGRFVNELTKQADNRTAHKEIRKAQRAKLTATPTNARPGMIFAKHWGYSISMWTFYQILTVSPTGKTATYRELQERLVSGDWQVGSKVAIEGAFIGEVRTGRLSVNDRGATVLAIKDQGARTIEAGIWDGAAKGFNSLD